MRLHDSIEFNFIDVFFGDATFVYLADTELAEQTKVLTEISYIILAISLFIKNL
jgi:hypothetical protein